MAGMKGTSGGIEAEPNVIPMIDILLVLLVIVMIANIRTRDLFEVQVPPAAAAPPGPPTTQIVLELPSHGGFTINGQPVADADLDTVLGQIYAGRPVKLLFVKAAADRTYQEVVSAMDRARGVGVEVIGLVPRR